MLISLQFHKTYPTKFKYKAKLYKTSISLECLINKK